MVLNFPSLSVGTLSLAKNYIFNLKSSFTPCWGGKWEEFLGGGNLPRNEKSTWGTGGSPLGPGLGRGAIQGNA